MKMNSKINNLFILILIPILWVAYICWNPVAQEDLPANNNFFHSIKRNIKTSILKLKKDPFANDHIPLSEKEIDILIFFDDQDLKTLECSIDAAKSLIMHPINKIYLIGKESKSIKKLTKKKQCEFVEIKRIIPKFVKKNFISSETLKEYAKLNANFISSSKTQYCLIIDHGVVLLQTQVFVKKDQQLISFSENYNLQDKLTAGSILKLNKSVNLSFNTSLILFDKTILKSMKESLEKKHNTPWQDSIHESTLGKHFSASECYSSYLIHHHKNRAVVLPERNIEIPYAENCGAKWQRGFLSTKYKSIKYKKAKQYF